MRESVSVRSSSSAALREQMVTFIDKMQENGADTEAEIVERYMEAAEQEGVTLTRDEVMDELAADFAGDMLDDADLFAKFSKENRTAAQKLLDSLKEFLAKVKTAFTGKYRDMAAQEAYGKDFAELEDIAKQWQAAFDAAKRQAEKTKTAAGEGDGRMMLKDYSYDALVRKPDMTLAVVENADGLTRKEVVDKAIEALNEKYALENSGVELAHIGGALTIAPKKEYWENLKDRYGKKNEAKLSKAALETLRRAIEEKNEDSIRTFLSEAGRRRREWDSHGSSEYGSRERIVQD